jgi:RNA recognition motif-containing protein
VVTPSEVVFVSGLDPRTTADAVMEHFRQCGEVSVVHLLRERGTGRNRGIAKVTFDTIEEAEDAIERLNGSEIDGRILSVLADASQVRESWMAGRSQCSPSNKLEEPSSSSTDVPIVSSGQLSSSFDACRTIVIPPNHVAMFEKYINSGFGPGSGSDSYGFFWKSKIYREFDWPL